MEHRQESSPVTDDPQARELLRRAFEGTARWPKDFKGFTADLTVNVNGKETNGPVIVKGPREVSVQLGDSETQKWAQEQLGMIAVHRGPRSFEESDGKYSLTKEEDGHPFGTKLHIHGSNSFYRIKDNRITQINRKMAHPGMNPFAFTINVEESAVTQDQKNLTTKYTSITIRRPTANSPTWKASPTRTSASASITIRRPTANSPTWKASLTRTSASVRRPFPRPDGLLPTKVVRSS